MLIKTVNNFSWPKPISYIRVGSIGDAHGSRNWVELSKRLERKCDKIIGLGDLIDRGTNNIEVINRAMELHSTGRYTQLLGNHELLFISTMLGNESSLQNWISNGGNTTLNEFKTNPLQIFFYKVLGITPKQQSLLEKFAYWLIENAKLYHIDEHGALYTHAGIPIKEDGTCALEYGGFTGLKCLDKAQEDLIYAFSKNDFTHKVFDFLQANDNAFLWNRTWFSTLINNDLTENLLNDLKVKMLIFGHQHISGVLDVDHKIFCIGGRILKNDASFIVNTPTSIEIESLNGQRTVIEKH